MSTLDRNSQHESQQLKHNHEAPNAHSKGNDHLILPKDLGERLTSTLGFASIQTLGSDLGLGVASGVWVETEKDLSVVERVLLLHTGALRPALTLGGANDALDFGRVDKATNISLLDEGGREKEVLLEGGWRGGRAVDVVEGLECTGGPDNEAAEMTTWCQLEEVQGKHGASLNTGDVAESL